VSPDGSQLYVANANDDTLAIVTTADNRLAATVPVHAMPGERLGATPDAVAVSPDGQRIYVALAGDDAVAVLGSSTGRVANSSPQAGSFHLLGFMPAGWYPSALAVSRSGNTVYVVSAKGLGSRPGPVTSTFQYDGNNMPGLLQSVPEPDTKALEQGTAAVQADIENATAGDNTRSSSNPIPAALGGASPIQHVVMIVRENRTFDQVLGDVGTDEGRGQAEVNGDPAYTVFGRDTTPNAHALVGDPQPGSPDPAYASSDNFYSDGEASIQGHYWTTSANVSDYVEKSWRLYYSPRPHLEDPLSSLAEPGGCSIFQSAFQRQSTTHGAFTFKDYGEEIGVANAAAITIALRIPGNASLGVAEHCTAVPAVDLDFANGSIFTFDTDNRHDATAFLADNGLTTTGTQVPGSKAMLRNFSYVTLPGDHTGGLAFTDTPRSRVAQNDAGLGLIVQSLSHSRYWSSTAIFVMEDDSQDGLDHVDGHRNLLYVISPYAKHTGPDGKPGYFSHVHFSQASVLKTIELTLDFPYLSTYDQNATALFNLFQAKDSPAQLTAADLKPFVVQPVPSFIDETSAQYKKANPSTSMLPASESRGLNLQAVDLAGPMLEVVDWQLAHPRSALPQPLVKELRQASLAVQHAGPIARLFQPLAGARQQMPNAAVAHESLR
jgi:YVTN family beta-propeller protein